MSTERKGRVPKTGAEVRQYNKTFIQAPDATAGSSADDYDATDTPSRVEAPSTGTATAHRSGGDGVWRFLRSHILEELLILAVAWGAYTLFAMNREVGEVRESVKGVQRETEATTVRIDHLEERLDGVVDRRGRLK